MSRIGEHLKNYWPKHTWRIFYMIWRILEDNSGEFCWTSRWKFSLEQVTILLMGSRWVDGAASLPPGSVRVEAPLRAEASQANLKKATTTKALGADGQSKPIKPQRLTSKAQAKPIKGPPRPFGVKAELKPIKTLGLGSEEDHIWLDPASVER